MPVAATTHGQSRSRAYYCWSNIIQRCTNPKHKSYTDYGGRGVGVCERWLDFANFYEDMGDMPLGMSIDRIDNSLGYFKENCRWSDRRTQQNNTRKNKILEASGKKMTVAQWARELGVSKNTITKRLRSGWPVEKALFSPVDRRFSNESVVQN